MAYLRVLRKGRGRYYYICRSERRGTQVRAKVLEYLGRDPEPARLKKALRYWGVKRAPSEVGTTRG
jgi:hypothetical protein